MKEKKNKKKEKIYEYKDLRRNAIATKKTHLS